MQAVRTVRLGLYFYDGPKRVTISRAKRTYRCQCGWAGHLINRGDLYAYTTDTAAYRAGSSERWHADHLDRFGGLIVVDRQGREIARYGC